MKKIFKKAELRQAVNNTSEQLNPNNAKYWQSRGYEERPENWQKRVVNG